MNTIFKYVKDKKGQPRACVMAVRNGNNFQIGWSLCSKRDRFDKKLAQEIAFGRATAKHRIPVPQSLQAEFKPMLERASRYFKTDYRPNV